jgi:hypothetical protein
LKTFIETSVFISVLPSEETREKEEKRKGFSVPTPHSEFGIESSSSFIFVRKILGLLSSGCAVSCVYESGTTQGTKL